MSKFPSRPSHALRAFDEPGLAQIKKRPERRAIRALKERKLYAVRVTGAPNRRIAPKSIFSTKAIVARGLLLVALLAAAISQPAISQDGSSQDRSSKDSETWYLIELDGQPAGWVVEREQTRGETLITETHTRLELSRGTAKTSMELESRFTETLDGRALSAWTRQSLGAMPVESSFEFRDDAVWVRHGGSDLSKAEANSLPLPEGEWLTPGAASQRVLSALESGATEFSTRVLDPSLGLEPVMLEWVLESPKQEVLTDRGGFRVARWRQTSSFAPGISTLLFIDSEGELVRSETSLMGLSMTQTLSDKEAATRKTASPEILVQTFVRPDRPIEQPRTTRRVVYELDLTEGEPPDLPSVGVQQVHRAEDVTRVTVALGSSPRLPEVDTAPFLRATPFLQHDDPVLRDLLAKALTKKYKNDRARSEALRNFVARYLVAKDLNTVLGTATEVAKSRSGDCTEHAVLLAALLRGAGIPSRVVSGLIYVDSFAGESKIFGYHMWTQALVDSRWLDLDATLPGVAFDAAHIAIATSALDPDQSALREMARVLPLLGRLRIRVLEVE